MLESQREPTSPRRGRTRSFSQVENRRTSSCSSAAGFLSPGPLADFFPPTVRTAFLFFVFTQFLVIAAYYTRIAPQACNCANSAIQNSDEFKRHELEDTLKRKHRGPQRLFYNRVPKCGSETLIELSWILSSVNDFKFVHSRIFFSYFLNEAEQLDFAIQFNDFTTPLFYERHLHFENVTKFGLPMPVYINIIRDPIDRIVSWYYFRRFQEGHMRKMSEDERNRTYDQCVLGKFPECVLPQSENVEEGYFKVIPFFCGQDDFCRQPTAMALERAISNVNKYFSVIGVSEQYDQFIETLEYTFPDYFRGIGHLYKSLGADIRKKYATTGKTAPSDAVRRIMTDKLQLDYEFYYFVKRRFEQYYSNMKANATPQYNTKSNI